jgi:Tfp pilus assembly PilM family ATPase
MALKLKKSAGTDAGRRRMSNLLAMDFATSGVKAVRLKKIKDRITLAAADILPPVGLDAEEHPPIPKPLAAYYTALCATMENAVLRVFQQVLPEEEDLEAIVREGLGMDSETRVGGLVLSRAKGKRESTMLGVAVPEKTVQHYLSLFDSGAPAPHSLELSGLSALSAFLYNCGTRTANQTVCVIETGESCTHAAFFHRNQLQLVNRFDVGGGSLIRQIQLSLGVDADMAAAILMDGTVDVSVQVRHILGPFTKQLSIYREFIERQNKSALSAVYMSGGLASSDCWQNALKDVLGFIPEVWNPFERLDVAPDAFPEHLKGQEPRFAAAVGAALAGMEPE